MKGYRAEVKSLPTTSACRALAAANRGAPEAHAPLHHADLARRHVHAPKLCGDKQGALQCTSSSAGIGIATQPAAAGRWAPKWPLTMRRNAAHQLRHDEHVAVSVGQAGVAHGSVGRVDMDGVPVFLSSAAGRKGGRA